MPTFLADTSIWSWASSENRPDITEKLAERLERDEIVTCAPVVLEALHRARTGEEYDSFLSELFLSVEWLTVGESTLVRALETQRELAHASDGSHRRPAIDYIVAAAAELGGDDIAVWAFDRDLRVICEHTGQPHEVEVAS